VEDDKNEGISTVAESTLFTRRQFAKINKLVYVEQCEKRRINGRAHAVLILRQVFTCACMHRHAPSKVRERGPRNCTLRIVCKHPVGESKMVISMTQGWFSDDCNPPADLLEKIVGTHGCIERAEHLNQDMRQFILQQMHNTNFHRLTPQELVRQLKAQFSLSFVSLSVISSLMERIRCSVFVVSWLPFTLSSPN
jgi:hypothetical protein